MPWTAPPSSGTCSMSTAATTAASAARRSAIARPIPLAAPVTSARRPSSRLIYTVSSWQVPPLIVHGNRQYGAIREWMLAPQSSVGDTMRITDVEPIVLRLDRVDTTRADGTQDAFLVRIHTDEGIVGVGEADTSPYWRARSSRCRRRTRSRAA